MPPQFLSNKLIMLPLAETEPVITKRIHLLGLSEKETLEPVARIKTLSSVFIKSTESTPTVKGIQLSLSLEYSREGVTVNGPLTTVVEIEQPSSFALKQSQFSEGSITGSPEPPLSPPSGPLRFRHRLGHRHCRHYLQWYQNHRPRLHRQQERTQGTQP